MPQASSQVVGLIEIDEDCWLESLDLLAGSQNSLDPWSHTRPIQRVSNRLPILSRSGQRDADIAADLTTIQSEFEREFDELNRHLSIVR